MSGFFFSLYLGVAHFLLPQQRKFAMSAGNGSGDLMLSIQQEVQDQQQERSPTHGSVVDAMPEQELNWFVLLQMFFQSASSSVGTVGFVWATVVLLGGFVSKLNKIEFGFVTVLSFFQAMRSVILYPA